MPAPLARRRDVLAGAGGLGLLAAVAEGCTAGRFGGGAAVPDAAPDGADPTAAAAASAPSVAADRALLEGLRGDLAAVAAQVRRARTGATGPTRAALDDLARLHRTQAAALGGAEVADPTGGAGVAPAPPVGTGADAVGLAEERWVRRLGTAAVAAGEPRLAVLLAAMAAGTAQQAALLAERRR